MGLRFCARALSSCRGHSSSRCAGLSLSRPLLLRSTGSRRTGSVVAAHGPSCSAACGIFPDQGSNPCPLHRQAGSQPLRHQGSPGSMFLFTTLNYIETYLKIYRSVHLYRIPGLHKIEFENYGIRSSPSFLSVLAVYFYGYFSVIILLSPSSL